MIKLIDYYEKDLKNFKIEFPFKHRCYALVVSENVSTIISKDSKGVSLEDLIPIMMRDTIENSSYRIGLEITCEIIIGRSVELEAMDDLPIEDVSADDLLRVKKEQNDFADSIKQDVISFLKGDVVKDKQIKDWDFDSGKVTKITLEFKGVN